MLPICTQGVVTVFFKNRQESFLIIFKSSKIFININTYPLVVLHTCYVVCCFVFAPLNTTGKVFFLPRTIKIIVIVFSKVFTCIGKGYLVSFYCGTYISYVDESKYCHQKQK